MKTTYQILGEKDWLDLHELCPTIEKKHCTGPHEDCNDPETDLSIIVRGLNYRIERQQNAVNKKQDILDRLTKYRNKIANADREEN